METISQQIELGDFLDESNADGERMRQIKAYQADSKKHGGLITVMQGSIVLGMNDSNIYRLVRDGRLDTFEHFGKKLLREIEGFVTEHPNITRNRESRLLRTQRGVFSSQSIQNLFRQLYQLANIPNASSHSGRRTFITNLSEKGISTRVIQELARHSSMVTTQRYIDVSNDILKNAVNAL